MNRKELFKRISGGNSNNIRFDDFVKLVEGFGYRLERTRGSHHLFVNARIIGFLNIQPRNGDAIPY